MTAPVIVLHAYSAHNRGDGWLVSLTHDLLLDGGHDPDSIITIALDPQSFSGAGYHGRFLATAGDRHLPFRSDVQRAAGALIQSVKLLRPLTCSARLVIGIGGGYLRAGSLVEGLRTFGAHHPQLSVAANCTAPTVYLPQSIGPLNGLAGWLIKRDLTRIDHVFVRDNSSLRDVPRARRMPDLAALHVGHLAPTLRQGEEILLSLRHVASDHAHASLYKLNELLGSSILAVQSTGRNNDDVPFTEALALPGQRVRPMPAALNNAAACVSVRLHGALAAITAGIPTIHLSYERKGWGVFDDLGLLEWVHDVRQFDPAIVAAQVNDLRADSERYWTALTASYRRLAAQRHELIEVLAQ